MQKKLKEYGEFEPFETEEDSMPPIAKTTNPTQVSSQVIGEPTMGEKIGKTLAENPLPSPYFEQIRQNEAKRQMLSTMPVRDENGRLESGLRGLVEGLSTYFDPRFGVARNWTDFSARLAAAGGRAAGGAINPSWDEQADRDKEIAKIDEDNERLMGIGQRDWQMRQQSATFGLNQQKEQNRQINAENNQVLRGRELDLREARQNFQKLNAEQKTLLSSIMKRGFYKEGVNKDEDAQIVKLGIILPDFDSRKPITKEQNGKFFQYDHDKQDWAEANGLPVDESEVPIEFSINGTRMKLRPRDIAGIEAAKERQISEQNFKRSQLEIQQEFEREERIWKAKQDEITHARDEASKEKARKEAEESRIRILRLQQELEDN